MTGRLNRARASCSIRSVSTRRCRTITACATSLPCWICPGALPADPPNNESANSNYRLAAILPGVGSLTDLDVLASPAPGSAKHARLDLPSRFASRGRFLRGWAPNRT
jgi:hypothetical protein